MTLPPLGPTVEAGQMVRHLPDLAGHLLPGEELLAVVGVGRLRPAVRYVAVTNVRLLGLDLVMRLGPQLAVRLDRADVIVAPARSGSARLHAVSRASGAHTRFGTVRAADVGLLRSSLDAARGSLDAPVLPDELPERWVRAAEIRDGRRRRWPGTTFVGGRPPDVTVRAILACCRPGEHPWLVLNRRLAAWSDRLAIVRAPVPGGSQPATPEPAMVLTYAEITDLEYLAEGATGVLVVHTRRFGAYDIGGVWTSGARSPREAANAMVLDRRTYLAAQPQLDRLDRLVATARRHAG